MRQAGQAQVRARKGVQGPVLPRPPAAKARPAPRWPRAKVRPVGAVTAARLCAVAFDIFGVAYSTSHMYAIMPQHGLVYKRLPFVLVNHASRDAVRAW